MSDTGNLNGLRQLISLAMRDGEKTVTVSTEMASMIVVEYEKHRVAASDAIDDKARQFSELESVKRVANEQAAQSAEFRDALQHTYNNMSYKFVKNLLDKHPSVCLADIQATAIEDLIIEFNANYYGEEISQWLEQQAEKVRSRSRLTETQAAATRILGSDDG